MLCANTALRGAIKGAKDAVNVFYSRMKSHETCIIMLFAHGRNVKQLFKLHEIQQMED